MRNFYRKTERGKTPVGIMKRAAESVINEGISIGSAAKNYEICRVGLKRFIYRYRSDSETASFGYKSSRRVSTDEQEKVLFNIINGFKKTGICPFDQNVFTDVDFSPSCVTDRPCPINDDSQKENAEPLTITEPVTPPKQRSSPVAGPSIVIPQSSCSTSEVPVTSEVSVTPEVLVTPLTPFEINISTKVFSPHCVRPLPKAGPRQTSNKGRKRRHTAILTDTPE
ncbi:hypothetical protein JTB14_018604 [Gonioctena quinquepunctata]|nr:hypothetical protein JTB14_018604 [Gonioctena quinquepunctata]